MIIKSVEIRNYKDEESKKYTFYEGEESCENNHISVIIGPNGCGKSILLRDIVNIVREINELKKGSHRRISYEYSVTSINDHKLQQISIGKKSETIKNINEEIEIPLEDYELPSRIVAISTIVTDKFPFEKNNNFYKYAGIRTSSQSTGTRTSIKDIVNSLANVDFNKLQLFGDVLTQLGFNKILSVSYQLKQKKYLNKFSNVEDMDNYFSDWKTRTDRETIPYNISAYRKLSEEQKLEIFELIKQNINIGHFIYNCFEPLEFMNFSKQYETLQLLSKLDLISYPSINISKNYAFEDIQKLSSGEFNIILHLLKILLNVENHTLLLIDEPEVSFHPNWQIQYIKLLELCLKPFSGIHVIIATHSHLLLSGLDPNNSSVIFFTQDGRNEILDYPISGWSPENILYKVFQITCGRNYYFEMDIRRIIKYIETREDNEGEIVSVINNVSKFILSKDDPLNELITQAKGLLK